jgi:hypothetical protein
MSDRRKIVPFFIPLLFGILSFSSSISNPRVAVLHGSDVLQLMASGMCFGVTLVLLIAFFRDRRAR